MTTGETVRAAGGLVHRKSESGTQEVLLVYRTRYGDWTFPKGKAHVGEQDADCALREVEEETGLRCVLEDELSPTSYRDHKGRAKSVRYWTMRPVSGVAGPRNEIDAVCWASFAAAGVLLTYDRDRALLTALVEPPPS